MRIQVRVIGATDPAAASGSTPARITSAAWRNSISTACTSDKTIAIVPKISTTAGAAPPPRSRARISRWVKCPPVETCSTHADQASPALSSSVMAVTPSVLAAATVSRPPVTSSSGLARRVSAIRAPAAITPPTATAAVIGSSHCWMRGDRRLGGQVGRGDPQPPGGGVLDDPPDPGGDRLRDPARARPRPRSRSPTGSRSLPPGRPVRSRCCKAWLTPRSGRSCSRSGKRWRWPSWPSCRRAGPPPASHRAARRPRSGWRPSRSSRRRRGPR